MFYTPGRKGKLGVVEDQWFYLGRELRICVGQEKNARGRRILTGKENETKMEMNRVSYSMIGMVAPCGVNLTLGRRDTFLP
jgi:hypothetical protein